MKRLFAVLFALTVITPALTHASQIVMVEPTKITGSTWHEFTNLNYNGNAWVNVWPSNKSVGMYAYLQAADGYTQSYGGLAVRSGPIEFGAGLGVENADGHVGARTSFYGILTRGKFQSATWFEHSNAGGSWALSNNLYAFAINPGTFEIGMRFQKSLGGGPMVRATFPNLGRFQPQLYESVMFDGDYINIVVGGAVNF